MQIDRLLPDAAMVSSSFHYLEAPLGWVGLLGWAARNEGRYRTTSFSTVSQVGTHATAALHKIEETRKTFVAHFGLHCNHEA